MPKPIAVLISDVHYNINTLEVADKAMRLAISKSEELDIPLIVCGDLHDTKSNLRGECVIAMIDTFKLCTVKPYIVRGNHDSLNEKTNNHSLKFLTPYANIVRSTRYMPNGNIRLISYRHNTEKLKALIKCTSKNVLLIMHQGIQGSKSGEYIQDKSAIRPEDVAGMRVISGHYHTRQDIPLPDGGLWSYVGNPYTLNFAEANDPEKGYQILMDDGSLEFVPTNLRKHVVIEILVGETLEVTNKVYLPRADDIVLIKAKGSKQALSVWDKDKISNHLGIENFRLDLIPTDTTITPTTQKNLSQAELLDSMIDRLSSTDENQKIRLKELWKGLT